MWIDWLDADNLSAYAAGLAGLEGSDARNGLASVSMGASGPDYGAGGTGRHGRGAAARLRLAQGHLGPGARPRLRHLGIARAT